LEQENGRKSILGNLAETEAFFESLTSRAAAPPRQRSSLMNLLSTLRPQLLRTDTKTAGSFSCGRESHAV
jgi:hypothetical protein